MSVRPLSASSRSAATLIELLLFIAIFSIVTFTVVPLLFSATQNRVLQQNKALVEENGAQVLQSAQYRAQGANKIIFPAPQQEKPVLLLQTGSGGTNPTLIGASGGYVYVVVKTKKIRITSPEVYVDQVWFRNTSPANGKAQSFTMSARVTRIAGTREKTPYAKTFTTSVSIPASAPTANGVCTSYDSVCIGGTVFSYKVVSSDDGKCYNSTVPLICDQVPVCGDEQVNGSDECDNGVEGIPGATAPYNSDAPDATCRSGCKRARCGDTVVDPGAPRNEQCDLGPSNSDTGTCTTSCKTAVCGDGFTQASNNEQCDLGAGNNVDTGACTSQCRNATCGDSKIWSGHEQCDPPNGTTCDNSCQIINPPTNNPYCTCDTKACFGSNQYKISYKCFTDNTMATPATFAGGQTATIGGQTAQITGNIVSKTFNVPPTISGDYDLSLPGLTLTMGTTCNVSPAVNSCSACLAECNLCPHLLTPQRYRLSMGTYTLMKPLESYYDACTRDNPTEVGMKQCSTFNSTTQPNGEWVLEYLGNCTWGTPIDASCNNSGDWCYAPDSPPGYSGPTGCRQWALKATGTLSNAHWQLGSGWASSSGRFGVTRDNSAGCYDFTITQDAVGPPGQYCELNALGTSATIHIDNTPVGNREYVPPC